MDYHEIPTTPEEDAYYAEQQQQDMEKQEHFCRSVLHRYETLIKASVQAGFLDATSPAYVSEADMRSFRAALGLQVSQPVTQPVDYPLEF